MRLDGRRFSKNVSDRRSMSASGGKIAGVGGIAGLVIMALIVWASGGNPLSVLTDSQQLTGNFAEQGYTPTEKENEYAEFASRILAGTEDVWTEQFRNIGLTYREPKMVLFKGAVSSACGNATSQTGPFYCPTDETVYIDLSFFEQMEREMGAGGDFAYAYVIAHEVGHHVQHLLGTLEKSQEVQLNSSKTEANKMSVRTELQADFYAGVWAYHDNQMFNSLEDGDIEEGLNAASKIGDDYLQKQAYGYTVPDSFNHGRSDQRVKWLKRGLSTGDIRYGDTFSPSYNSL